MAFRIDSKIPSSFNKITISLASPESILDRSHGEVLKPETINYRTYKPERDGLFCERIFGPVKDYECHCGKYKRIRYKGIVCDRCGVEVTEKKVRRERMGHIQLVVPVVHIWFFRSLPNKIGAMLGLQTKKLEMIIYYERYAVIQAGIKEADGVNYLDFLTEEEYFDIIEALPPENQHLDDDDPDKFIAKMGAEAVHDLLQRLDIDKESYDLRHKANTETSQQRKAEALKRLQVFEAFRDARKRAENRPEWMIVKIVPVIPPELRPLVPLDGGRFATSDLNDLYRRVIIRNNRLKRLIEIKAPDVIMRNEKRMLQEAVDSLIDNSRKSSAVKTDSNRPLKSLSDSLKGKRGRFRQNLLGKRVDYSGRSVIVVGPNLKLNECGFPKEMAAELFKPFIIRKLLERGIVKTVKSAKKIVERKDAVVWDILENILKGHPVLLNRAPTLHRLGIQSFQPKLIEGKAIQLHPLVCTAFNADFDGDQMAVHVPLGNAAVLEAQILMLASHNILNPANGAPITVPSQDMVLGLYYITKARKSTPDHPVKGEGKNFYSHEEVNIAYSEGEVDLHAIINVKVDVKEDGKIVNKLVETTVGRVMFNQFVPKEYGFINALLTKKALRDIIGEILKETSTDITAQFLDDIKSLGFNMAFKGGLSFNLGNVSIPDEKSELIDNANQEVEEVLANYNMGFITNNERYNQIIDIWTHANSRLTNTLMKQLTSDDQGFNPVYMMLDSGARGSKEQIRQLSGMRGLMAKPQKSGAKGGEIIENPILSNFKEGLSVLEYFISTHGARKGLADTALKTADAGYLTRRLVDVAQDVVINEADCGTLRGLTIKALKKNEEVVETLYDRILGRVTLHDVYHPVTNDLVIEAGKEVTEEIAKEIEDSPIENVEIRSVLTCESKRGVCARCYGRNLASGRLVQKGEAVGVIAAQSIGEPGTQLTLRTFHQGGTASNIAAASKIEVQFNGVLEIDELRSVKYENAEGAKYQVVIGRSAEMRLIDPKTGVVLASGNIPYAANLYVKNGSKVKKGDLIADWDPYNAVILSEVSGNVAFENIIEGISYRVESDEQTGYFEKVIVDSRIKNQNPIIKILEKDGSVASSYDLPVGSHILVDEGKGIKAGDILVKIPRAFGKSGDITGGLPRVTELFEARNPSEPAVVSEIDGVVSFGPKLKRGNREVIITSKTGEEKKYLISTSKQILAQKNDFVKAGASLSDGVMTPADILAIKGPVKVQEYIVNEIQEVYRLQGVKINDKHFEVIVRQMMRKVQLADSGDTRFLEGELVNRVDFQEVNDEIFGMKVVVDPGDSDTFKQGQIVSARKLRDENSSLKRRDKKLIESRDAQPATARQVLQGITRASLQTNSFISAASFQETTKVLTLASISAKSDDLLGLKENVIVGHKIPAGTGLKKYDDIIVGSKEEYEAVMETTEVVEETTEKTEE
ncbi:MAG: DNA-directed RNA polymerase subunit beta' [Lentimicrobiaceae bacterium]|jgi:DNA-directed RNA polymerase subunit beta'|nr:DNA-directed RNA polymerase subunit beta' [Lentimicrobiaceae bacterium]MBT3455123.1 DNA-directed RNA polymerase subunit beta' [Lentimicrobiaceae bacterium]MBT3818698.1 DNA-directed RNA polymerase subunit beta' [Lentimicrobiaceae bacterium]MBT4062280.1 DNA-directed RNA polymerase subunit beta' [Lentimicrobiaceae bacterium]MBT4189585.1 DNA-directed RNA polymerase subunit beta' [Lentimicrobiaceae bacterium]